MDRQKYESRILELAARSLAVQRIRHLKPIKLKAERDRFFLIECNRGTHLFIRWEDWLWKIDNMAELPPEHKKKVYASRNRPRARQRPRMRPVFIDKEILRKLQDLEAQTSKRQRPRRSRVVAPTQGQ